MATNTAAITPELSSPDDADMVSAPEDEEPTAAAAAAANAAIADMRRFAGTPPLSATMRRRLEREEAAAAAAGAAGVDYPSLDMEDTLKAKERLEPQQPRSRPPSYSR